MKHSWIVSASILIALATHSSGAENWNFDFGTKTGSVHVGPSDLYNDQKGFGFEPENSGDLQIYKTSSARVVTSIAPFYFSAALPEGNYRVTLTCGGLPEATETTVKAELRRLMLEHVTTNPGGSITRSFIVNIRSPQIAATDSIKPGSVKLKSPRESTQEAWAWDDRLTLEFNGKRPAVSAITIEHVYVPTVFLLGDSTVCDQSAEPYTSWGQMLPRFFRPDIAIANHAESGESYEAAFSRRRIDKILSAIKPGDYFIVQFGHNDQKADEKAGRTASTEYKSLLERCVGQVIEHGGKPLLVTPMERREFNPDGSFHPSLTDYAEAVRQAGAELHIPVLDLNRMSQPFYIALEAHGKDYSRRAFALTDDTHHNAYGAYELAKCIVMGIRDSGSDLAQHISHDFAPFDPAHPDDPETFAIPASSKVTHTRPLGDDATAANTSKG